MTTKPTRKSDFRSDTVTKPTPPMLAAMQAAEVGDDVYGEDPTVRALETEVAALLGFEAALYVPSGTMANQLAIALHTRPGDTVLTEQDSHCYLFEAGGAAALSGVQFDLIPREAGFADAVIAQTVKADGLHIAPTTLCVVENTHNVGAGRVLSAHEMSRIAATAKRHGLAVHCDGARIWNAAIASGSTEAELLRGFDTAAVCFSKGLGAPVGSALCGPRPLIERARKLRKRWGGGMRQAGSIAAGALFAVRNHRERLAEDHRLARHLAQSLREISDAIQVRYPEPGTNLVYFKPTHGAADAHVRHIADQGVLVSSIAGGWIRAVTHLDVGAPDVDRLLAAVRTLLSGLSPG